MKKLILLGALAAVGYAVYRQYSANQAEQELGATVFEKPRRASGDGRS